MSDEHKTFSIAIRLRRISYEDAYIVVPISNGILKVADDGSPHIDTDALIAEAIRISNDKRIEWVIEETRVEPHPLQQAPPEERHQFDAFYS